MRLKPKNDLRLTVREITLFAVLGALMYCTKFVMQLLPNIHLLGLFIVSETLVFRKKALYPLYIYVLLDGLFSGFALWWIPYTYVWTVLWLFAMLIPEKIPVKLKPFVYAGVSAVHGLLFGVLYAPFQMLAFKMSFNATLAWIAAGFPFDAIHGLSNFLCGFLIIPFANLLSRADRLSKG